MSNFSCEVAYPTITGGKPTNLDQPWTAVTDVPPLTPWSSVSISSNGVNAIVCSGFENISQLEGAESYIYYSNDSLVTWHESTITSNYLFSVSISDTGYALACGWYMSYAYQTNYGYIYLSIDNGQSWNTVKSDGLSWDTIAISKNGEYAIAGNNTNIYYSSLTVGFAIWTPCNLSGTLKGLSMSSSGLYALASGGSKHVFWSNDYGHTWTESSTKNSDYLVSVSISSTGQYGIAISYSSSYYSSDYGITWLESNLTIETLEVGSGSVSISSTGQYCLACIGNVFVYNMYIYYSSDYGQTWTASLSTSEPNGWQSVSISGTGQYGLACQFQWDVYTYTVTSSSVNYITFETTPAYVNIETDLVYIFNEDKDGTNLIPYTTNIVKNTTDLGTLFKNQYNNSSLTTKYNATIGYVNLNPTQPWNISNSPQNVNWNSVSISSTGQYGIASTYNPTSYESSIYNSSDYGQTWDQVSGVSLYPLFSVCISGNGMYGLACGYYTTYDSFGDPYTNGVFYRSTNYGNSWETVTPNYPAINFRAWSSVSLSYTGQYGLASIGGFDTGFNPFGGIYYSSNYGISDSWTPSDAPSIGWKSISISSTGQYGLAVTLSNGSASTNPVIYYSSDFGHTWILSSFSNSSIEIGSVSISSTGQYGLAGGNNGLAGYGYIYYSSDYGQTWNTSNTTSVYPNISVSISSTGQYGLACANNTTTPIGSIYYSSDYGHTWTPAPNTTGLNWYSVSISSTGNYGLACVDGGSVYYIEFSTTPTVVDLSTILQPINPAYWSIVPSTSGQPWNTVSISSTGQHGIAGVSDGVLVNGSIYYSSDYGNTWTLSSNPGNTRAVFSTSISSTGQYGLAYVYGIGIIYSSDYGFSWQNASLSSVFITSISLSGSGQYGIACAGSEDIIYYSTNCASDNSWIQSNGCPSQYWSSVSNSSTGQYALACYINTVSNNVISVPGAIYYSSNYGQDWSEANTIGSENNWFSVSISSTGQYGLACIANTYNSVGIIETGAIYYSSDFGHTWTLAANTYGQSWGSVSISGTGQYGLASIYYTTGYIYYSTDFGHTWTASNTVSSFINSYGNKVAISGTGQYGLSAYSYIPSTSSGGDGYIYRLNG